MTTQDLFNEATELVKSHGFADPLLNVHNTCNKYGQQWAITLLNPEYISTQNHKALLDALFELNTLLTELKAKSCTTDTPTTTNS